MREKKYRAEFCKSGKPYRRAHVVNEREERSGVGFEHSVVENAVCNSSHRVLADSEVDIFARKIVSRDPFFARDRRFGRAAEVGITAYKPGNRLAESSKDFSVCSTGRHFRSRFEFWKDAVQIFNFKLLHILELSRFLRIFFSIFLKKSNPCVYGTFSGAFYRSEILFDVVIDKEKLLRVHSEAFFYSRKFLCTKRRTM